MTVFSAVKCQISCVYLLDYWLQSERIWQHTKLVNLQRSMNIHRTTQLSNEQNVENCLTLGSNKDKEMKYLKLSRLSIELIVTNDTNSIWKICFFSLTRKCSFFHRSVKLDSKALSKFKKWSFWLYADWILSSFSSLFMRGRLLVMKLLFV